MTEWTVEGVARCPGCGLYFDVEATTLSELEQFIKAHDCAKAKKETRFTL